jgi:formylglycine-generating enzyme required for sulfatase activity
MRRPTEFSTTLVLTLLLAAATDDTRADQSMLSSSRSPFSGTLSSALTGFGFDTVADSKLAESETRQSALVTPPLSFRDCSTCPELVEVPTGRFLMGSVDGDLDERPAHEVVIQQPFAVGKFEVTFNEWDACVIEGGCQGNKSPSDEGWGKATHPVINVNWIDTHEYLGWLSRKTGKAYRLLSEAEWEYAARAGTSTRYAFGDTLEVRQAQLLEGKQGTGHTVEVGSFSPNMWGLHDMHGNVWEWVEDCYVPNYVEAPSDGSARVELGCRSRVLRGGSWDYGAQDLRSAVRYKLPPIYRVDEVGFRVARALQ